MKTIKLILAWIDWSTYGLHMYTFPKTLCSLFWRTVLSLLMLPLIWFGHIWNLRQTKQYFKEGYIQDWPKVFCLPIAGAHAIVILGGVVVDGVSEGMGYNWLIKSQGVTIAYLKAILGGGILWGVVALIIYVAYYIITAIIEKRKREYTPRMEDSVIYKGYKAVKDNYCPIIDWTVIK